MSNIDIYNNSEIMLQKKSSKIFLCFIFIVLFYTTFLMILIFFYRYNLSYQFKGLVNKQYLLLTVSNDELKLLNGTNYIIVNEKKYKFNIVSVSDKLYDINYNSYYNLKLFAKIDKDILVENNLLDIDLFGENTTLYKELIKKIKKGIIQQ